MSSKWLEIEICMLGEHQRLGVLGLINTWGDNQGDFWGESEKLKES